MGKGFPFGEGVGIPEESGRDPLVKELWIPLFHSFLTVDPLTEKRR
jgi:hypothetical protein